MEEKKDDLSIYPRPSVAVDIATFSVIKTNPDDKKELPKMQLAVLLMERGEAPFGWALPGGFVRKETLEEKGEQTIKIETVEQAAERVMKEKIGMTNVDLQQLHVFSDPGRDSRGWTMSVSFTATADMDTALKPQNNAKQACWFAFSYKKSRLKVNKIGLDKYETAQTYQVKLKKIKKGKDSDTIINFEIEVFKTITAYTQEIRYRIIKNDNLAFEDHAKIIVAAIYDLRKRIEISADAFRFLPEKFTLTDVQLVYELILGKKQKPANFRRKISKYVEKTDQKKTGMRYRSAILYKRNQKVFIGIDSKK